MIIKPELALAALLLCEPLSARAQLVGVGLDGEARMVDGEVTPPPALVPDRLVFLEFRDGKVTGRREVEAPVSFQGPPSAIAFSPTGGPPSPPPPPAGHRASRARWLPSIP
ncbi:hypothetical protein PIB19_07890 [Sphingomonas sp. 7/4-4]|uniref:hypothetical protein n=1 Tax=Sphingomonas sp. 7/4-4 TaxID=3018446 RepID=UPI0022F38443|nr:hypothetical protein [Sphingomonas sp. 7/4-4]WBY09238.1 hypothetical protein PIB19_07890 [Sphingomonas sp. 7/4-4]